MQPIIFIHGAWATPRCWRYFAPMFTERGYRIVTPAWPYKDGGIQEQCAHPDSRLAGVGIPEIVAHYESIIRREPEPPVLVGHSFGGLIVQLLLDQGLGAVGIAISSVPPRGVSALGSHPLRAVRKIWSLFLRPSPWPGILPPPGANDETKHLRRVYGIETQLVPESRRVFRQLLTHRASVDFRNGRRAPLLLVGCGQDQCVPAKVQSQTWRRYRASAACTDLAVFPDLTHLGIAEPGNRALAAYCMAWVEDRLNDPRRPTAVAQADLVAAS